ncbi:hypothetical protein E2C01_026836 [Portunus trituberculatus]|uniref:Uncharacterized protein n=1 Tax=Portunus trituberculatus TaxID=210409 RepID=A0A5B7EJ88_PORTR|nr:hypothetical protein [Portunus trituberculatus]
MFDLTLSLHLQIVSRMGTGDSGDSRAHDSASVEHLPASQVQLDGVWVSVGFIHNQGPAGG